MQTQVHNTAKAVIRRDGRLLAVRCRDCAVVYYTLPGGQQHPGELLTDTVRRECLEETGCAVDVGDLLLVCERPGCGLGHMVDHYFLCELRPDSSPSGATTPDYRQEAFEWLPSERIEEYALHPLNLRGVLAGVRDRASVYGGPAS